MSSEKYIFTANTEEDTISIVDVMGKKVVDKLDLKSMIKINGHQTSSKPVIGPYSLKIDPQKKILYSINCYNNSLFIIDIFKKKILNNIGVGRYPLSLIHIYITKSLGGVPSITILGVIFAGLIGATIGPKILSIFGITNNIARGIAMGTASHGLGTAIALEEGEVQGAMAGLSVGLTGLTTALIIPFMAKILINFM